MWGRDVEGQVCAVGKVCCTINQRLKFLVSSFDVNRMWLHLMGRRQRGVFS